MVRHGESSAGSYLADPTSFIPSHCASIVATSTLRVNINSYTKGICFRLYLPPWQWAPTAACNYRSNLGSVHQVPITAGWTEAVWNTKFARHFYTWPALGIEPQTFWYWVQRPIHLARVGCVTLTVTHPIWLHHHILADLVLEST